MSNESVNSRNSMSFEQVLQENGQLVYTNVGDSMWLRDLPRRALRFLKNETEIYCQAFA